MKPKEGISVDGSSRGNPGDSAYRGVDLKTGEILFDIKIGDSTNNIAEFIGLTHAINYAIKNNYTKVYSDSVTAIAWVRNKKANTTLAKTPKTEKSLELVSKSEKYLMKLDINYMTYVEKWDTKKWGESPADFGFK